jgi:hypothetical protein
MAILPVAAGWSPPPRYAAKERDLCAARKRQNWNTAENTDRVPIKFQGE